MLVRFVEGLELALQVAGGKYEAGLLFSDVAFALKVPEILFFLTQSEVIEPVSPQPAQLGIHFYCYHNTQLEMHLLEGPD